MVLTIYNTSMSTKADASYTETSDPGAENERLVDKLDIFFYHYDQNNTEALLHIQKTDLNNTSGNFNVPIYLTDEQTSTIFGATGGTASIYVIANLPETVNITNTKKTALENLLVTSEEFSDVVGPDGSYVAPKSFVMAGETTVSNAHGEKSITGSVALVRAASKVTMSLWIPESLVVDVLVDDNGNNVQDGNEQYTQQIWKPYFVDPEHPEKGMMQMHMGFHKGIGKTYVDAQLPYDEANVFETGYTSSFKYVRTETRDMNPDQNVVENKNFYLFTCDVSFFSYAFSWLNEENDIKAPYFTLMIPWVKEDDYTRYQTYYYQVVVNGKSKQLVRNKWYDIVLTVNKLGSRVQNQAYLLGDQSCYVLDWATAHAGVSGPEASENVTLKEWRYLVVPETTIEINNKDEGYIYFDASHSVAFDFVQTLDAEGKAFPPTYYINCSTNPPSRTNLNLDKNINLELLDGSIRFHHVLSQDMYSPVHANVRMWLDFNKNGSYDEATEGAYSTIVEVIQYPPIYIEPSQSASRSVFVNGQRCQNPGDGNGLNNGTYDIRYSSFNLGAVPGTSSKGDQMFVISVSSFDDNDTFSYNGQDYYYLIGDPRLTAVDNNMNNNGVNMSNHWVQAKDVEGTTRKLQNYYPTASQGDVFRVIAPKFRIASPLSSGYSRINTEGAAMRCASYQEAGYPAGRWRLPTMAEIRFIIHLQQQNMIIPLFYGGNGYFSSTNKVQYNESQTTITYIDNISDDTNGSVRCVYDDWYWGSEPEARKNNAFEGGYEFTWGDEPR